MQRVDVQLEDDLTGGPAVETVLFGIDGRSYEIDLNAKHATDLRQKMARFIEHARRAHPKHPRMAARTAASRERSRQIRQWAQGRGLEVADHGRLPAEVIAGYASAHTDSQRSDRRTHRGSTSRRAKRQLVTGETTTDRRLTA